MSEIEVLCHKDIKYSFLDSMSKEQSNEKPNRHINPKHFSCNHLYFL